MDISPELLGRLIAHAREDPANECCGVVAVRGISPRRAVRVYRTRNIHESPLKFEIDSKELLGIWQQIEAEGLELGAIYHSHVRSAPYPSQTDISFAARWPGVEWIIVGLKDPAAPEVRSFLINGSEVSEVAI